MAKTNKNQQVIKNIFAELFGEEIGPDDMFIDFGGNSIIALPVRDELARNGIIVSINEILGEPIGKWG